MYMQHLYCTVNAVMGGRGRSTVAYRFDWSPLLQYGLKGYIVTGHYQERQTASQCPFVVALKPDYSRHGLVLWGFPTTM